MKQNFSPHKEHPKIDVKIDFDDIDKKNLLDDIDETCKEKNLPLVVALSDLDDEAHTIVPLPKLMLSGC